MKKQHENKTHETLAFAPDDFSPVLSYHDYAVMGLVSTTFSGLDTSLSFLIWSLLAKCDVITTCCDEPEGKLQGIGAAVTAMLSFRRKIDLVVALGMERFAAGDSRIIELKKIATQCAAVEAERNTLIHSWWGPHGRPDDFPHVGGSKYTVDRRKGLRRSSTAGLDRLALVGLAERMQALGARLQEMRFAMYPRQRRS